MEPAALSRRLTKTLHINSARRKLNRASENFSYYFGTMVKDICMSARGKNADIFAY